MCHHPDFWLLSSSVSGRRDHICFPSFCSWRSSVFPYLPPATYLLCYFFSWCLWKLWWPHSLPSHWDTGLLCLGHMGNPKKAMGQGFVPACRLPSEEMRAVFQPRASAPPSFISLGRQKAQPQLCFHQGKVRITATWHKSVWFRARNNIRTEVTPELLCLQQGLALPWRQHCGLGLQRGFPSAVGPGRGLCPTARARHLFVPSARAPWLARCNYFIWS